MNEQLDMTVQVGQAKKEPKVKTVAEEISLTPAELWKLLITVGAQNHTTYFSLPTAEIVLKLSRERWLKVAGLGSSEYSWSWSVWIRRELEIKGAVVVGAGLIIIGCP